MGTKEFPNSILNPLTAFFNNIMEFSAVAALLANSWFTDPAYSPLSPTFSKLSRTASKLLIKGAIAPIDSLPNKSFSVLALSDSSKFFNALNTSSMAPFASTCMRLAISVALSPNLEKASA